MKNKFLKKFGIILLSAATCTSTLPICAANVYASEAENIVNIGDHSGEGAVSGILADNRAVVIVDSIEAEYTKNDPDGFYQVDVVKLSGGSELTVNEDIYVKVDGTTAWDATTAICAEEESKVNVKGNIRVESELDYTRFHKDQSGHDNTWFVEGIASDASEVNVDGDVILSTENGDAYGLHILGGVATVHGSIIISSEAKEESILRGAHVSNYMKADGDFQSGILIVDGDIDITGGGAGRGLCIYDESKAYIKGNVSVDGTESAVGILASGNAIAVIDGTLSVEATDTRCNRARFAQPYDPGEMDSEDTTSIYVYRYVDNTKYMDGIFEVEETDSNGETYIEKYEVHDIPGGNRPEYDQNFSHLKYIIRTDDGISTNARVFSDEDLGIKGFYYGSAGEAITVKGNDKTIYGVKNKDSSIDIKVRDNGDGSWTIIVPDGGGVHLQAILEKAEEVIEVIEDTLNESVEETPVEASVETKPSVVLETVEMTQKEIAENVTGSAEYVAKQAEIEAAMSQVLDNIEAMTEEQIKELKATGLSIDAGGCTVADAKVTQLIIKALDKGIPMNVSFKTNGSLVKIKIPAGFNLKSFINADGSIDFVKLLNALR